MPLEFLGRYAVLRPEALQAKGEIFAFDNAHAQGAAAMQASAYARAYAQDEDLAAEGQSEHVRHRRVSGRRDNRGQNHIEDKGERYSGGEQSQTTPTR